MIGITFALLSALFIAFCQILLRKSYKDFSPSIAFLFDAVFGLFIWIPLALYMGVAGTVSWPQAILYGLISAVLSEAVVFYALKHGQLAVTATILATYPVYTVLFSRIFNAEFLSQSAMIFVLFAIIGSVIASLPNQLTKKELWLNKGVAWPFIAAVCIGISDTISKRYINSSGNFSFLLSLGLVQIPVAFAYLKIEKQSFSKAFFGVIKNIGHYKYSLLGGLFNIVGTGFLWLSFSYAPASIASPVTGTNGVLTVILSKFLLHEKISKIKYIGMLLAFIGVIGISLLHSN